MHTDIAVEGHPVTHRCLVIVSSQYRISRFIGQTLRILVEEPTADGAWTGHSSNYLYVTFTGEGIQSGDFVDVKLTELTKNRLHGVLV